MKNIFRPTWLFKTMQEIDLELLKKSGIVNLVIDIDNTLVPYYEKNPTKEALNFLEKLEKEKFNVVLASNNNKERVSVFSKNLNLPYYFSSLKPLPFVYKKIKKNHYFNLNNTVCIGDQILTDVLGANCFGFKSIYLEPIINKDSLTTVISRKIEKMIRKIFKI